MAYYRKVVNISSDLTDHLILVTFYYEVPETYSDDPSAKFEWSSSPGDYIIFAIEPFEHVTLDFKASPEKDGSLMIEESFLIPKLISQLTPSDYELGDFFHWE